MIRFSLLFLALLFFGEGTIADKKIKLVIYIIGDSTLKNGSGKGDGGSINDNFRIRGTIKVTGEEEVKIISFLIDHYAYN